jgi:hypothetical protein
MIYLNLQHVYKHIPTFDLRLDVYQFVGLDVNSWWK